MFSIYSDEIPKLCSFCEFSDKINDELVLCRKKNKNMNIDDEACKHYKYNILKRNVRRKKTLSADFKPEDFEL